MPEFFGHRDVTIFSNSENDIYHSVKQKSGRRFRVTKKMARAARIAQRLKIEKV